MDPFGPCWGCFYGCPGGDHLIEALTGCVYSHARAALRLMRFGFYDEALALVRTIGEIANLVSLFTVNPADLETWKNASDKERRNN